MKKNLLTIVHVAAHYPPFLGGLEKVAQEVAHQLAQDDYNITVITSNIEAKTAPHLETHHNLTIKRLRSFNFAHTTFIPGLAWQLIKTRKPALFHLHLAQAYVPEMVWLAAKLRNIPYVVHFHLDVERSGKLGGLFVLWKRWIQPRIIKDAVKIITLSPDQTKLIIERYKKNPTDVIFIGNGVGKSFFEIGKFKREIHKPVRLLFVGRLSSQKRPERLVEAMSIISSDATLAMVGDGELRSSLENQAKKLSSKNIEFLGRLDGEKLLEAYRRSDVFVLPSDREGMPLVLLEAMATGLPILGSDVIGIHELIENVGILVKNPSGKTFADAIDKIAQEPKHLIKLGQASLKEAENYSWDKLVKQLEMVYQTILPS